MHKFKLHIKTDTMYFDDKVFINIQLPHAYSGDAPVSDAHCPFSLAKSRRGSASGFFVKFRDTASTCLRENNFST